MSGVPGEGRERSVEVGTRAPSSFSDNCPSSRKLFNC